MAVRLNRLAALYSTLERLRTGELHVAEAALDHVERLTSMHRAVDIEHAAYSRAALHSGNRVDWMLSRVSQEFAQTRLLQLTEVRLQREQALQAALLAQRESQISAQQIDCVIKQARQAEALQDDRQAQATADDRYASMRASNRPSSVAIKRRSRAE